MSTKAQCCPTQPTHLPHFCQVWGNLGAFLERLDDEWNSSLKVSNLLKPQSKAVEVPGMPSEKSCVTRTSRDISAGATLQCAGVHVQALDPHANEYMERLKDEAVLLALAQKVDNML